MGELGHQMVFKQPKSLVGLKQCLGQLIQHQIQLAQNEAPFPVKLEAQISNCVVRREQVDSITLTLVLRWD